MIWQVGDGRSINFWYDAWVPFLGEVLPIKHWVEHINHEIVFVQDVMKPGGEWDESLLDFLPRPLLSAIMDIKTIPSNPDKIILCAIHQESLCIRTNAVDFMVYEWLHMCLSIKKPPDINNLCSPMLLCAIMDAIWQARNNKRFNGVTASQHSILQHAYRVCQYWIVAFTEPDYGNEESEIGEGAHLSSDQKWVKPPPS
ncbi:hypothetical protein IFM89_023709 [Coptis chinensis]|uniref:Uncharacterized protein n=1 Tax=Coptis chinensis TaxID=261450 RepID=A0A835I4W2_9MAGN|nr:hypothetical protein IFM89_023709 [Coptis chinensis]